MKKSSSLLDEIEVLTAEIHSLLKQGVKALSEKRIEQRQQKIELLFIHPSRISDSDKQRLLAMLEQDKLIKQILEREQREYHNRNLKRSKINIYTQNS